MLKATRVHSEHIALLRVVVDDSSIDEYLLDEGIDDMNEVYFIHDDEGVLGDELSWGKYFFDVYDIISEDEGVMIIEPVRTSYRDEYYA